jgi:hypothetical protein
MQDFSDTFSPKTFSLVESGIGGYKNETQLNGAIIVDQSGN